VIEVAQGNLLEADAEALVNTVNCAGVMGKGVALQFKQAFPEMVGPYEQACKRGDIRPGRVQVWPTGALRGPRFVINFPTKREWFRRSRYADIASGLEDLVRVVSEHNIHSIAVPPLGCGAGGLAWAKVRPMIEQAFEGLPQVRVLLYAPGGAPAGEHRVIRTERPPLTTARALFLAAIDRYTALAYPVSLLEIQKLAYLLQEAGQPLRLNIRKHIYGPYADNLNKVLETLEGHYIRGYDGERTPDKPITLCEGAAEEANALLDAEPAARARLEEVARLIEGFETPYGMELLATVHFVSTHETPPALSSEEAVRLSHAWSERKRQLLRPEHIRHAWLRLEQYGWLRTRAA